MSGLLPKIVRELEGIIGLPSALRLAQRYGGVHVYVPATIAAEHQLAQILGLEAATALAGRYAGSYLLIPRCAKLLRAERDRRIRQRTQDGASPRQLALEFKMTDRQVWRIIAGVARTNDPRQLSFF